MSVAIETKVIPATERFPTRIVATTANGQRALLSKSTAEHRAVEMKLPRPESDEAAHRAVAETLRNRMQWPGRLVGGSTAAGYVFVFDDEQYPPQYNHKEQQ